MTCFHCHKLGHIAKFCRARGNKPVNQFVDQKGKNQVDVEETKNEMNKIWKKKSEEKQSKDSHSSPSVDNPSLVNKAMMNLRGGHIARSISRPPE